MISLVFNLAYFTLLCAFVLRMLEPGTPETAILFAVAKPFMPLANGFISLLSIPTHWILAKLAPWIPAGWKAWFPTCPTGFFIHGVLEAFSWLPGFGESKVSRQILVRDFGVMFPGRLDWTLVMTGFIWNGVQNVLRGLGESMGAMVRKKRMSVPVPPVRVNEDGEPQFPVILGGNPADEVERVQRVSEIYRELEPAFQNMESNDELTGLFNKAVFFVGLQHAVLRARFQTEFVGVVIANLDDFTQLKETYGPAFTDKALLQVANTLRQVFPEQLGLLCRTGEDAFAAILVMPEAHFGAALAEQARHRIQALSFPQYPTIRIKTSFGAHLRRIKSQPPTEQQAEALMAEAQAQLIRAKQNGKNRVCDSILG